ncbi:hypothetical protein RDABS01_017432 [Bienertia sinuspersici]
MEETQVHSTKFMTEFSNASPRGKYSCLNPAARSILINSLLVALAAHIMSIYLLPQNVLKRINSTIIKFYWGGNSQTKPIYWKSRDTLELRKEEGGLGLRNLTSLNQALLFHQVWRISKNTNTLASRVMRHRYGGDPLAIPRREVKIRNALWVMRSMVNCAKVLKSLCGMKIGNGRTTPIQEKIWVGKEPIIFRNRAIGNQLEKPKFVSDIIYGQSWNGLSPKDFIHISPKKKRKRMRSYGYRKKIEITRLSRDTGTHKA